MRICIHNNCTHQGRINGTVGHGHFSNCIGHFFPVKGEDSKKERSCT